MRRTQRCEGSGEAKDAAMRRTRRCEGPGDAKDPAMRRTQRYEEAALSEAKEPTLTKRGSRRPRRKSAIKERREGDPRSPEGGRPPFYTRRRVHTSLHTSLHISLHTSLHISLHTSLHMSLHTSLHTSLHISLYTSLHI